MKYYRRGVILFFIVSVILFAFVRRDVVANMDDTIPYIKSGKDVLEIQCSEYPAGLVNGLSAYDEKDGDITNSILVNNISEFDQDGNCVVSYLVFDQDMNSSSYSRKVKLTDYEPPKFDLIQPLVFRVGEDVKVAERIKAVDLLDGIISSNIKISSGIEDNIGTLGVGEYGINVAVTNSNNDEVTMPLNVRILEKNSFAPVINLSNYMVYIKKGDSLDTASYIKSVTDNNGTEISRDGMSINSNVDTNKAGVYEVIYSIDYKGNVGVTALVVVVE